MELHINSADTLPVTAVVAAAGSGTRLGANRPKAFVELQGRTLVERALDGLAGAGVVSQCVVMVSADMREELEQLLAEPANQAAFSGMRIAVGIGGAERADSVLAGLHLVEQDLGTAVNCVQGAEVAEALVLVHDAARCLTPPSMIRGIVATLREQLRQSTAAGVIPALPVTDTIKQVDGELVASTPARESLVAVQTPQAFLLSALLDANRKHQASLELGRGHARLATDDASIMEMAGYPVAVTPGDELAMKITTQRDYAIASMLASTEN